MLRHRCAQAACCGSEVRGSWHGWIVTTCVISSVVSLSLSLSHSLSLPLSLPPSLAPPLSPSLSPTLFPSLSPSLSLPLFPSLSLSHSVPLSLSLSKTCFCSYLSISQIFPLLASNRIPKSRPSLSITIPFYMLCGAMSKYLGRVAQSV